MKTVMFIKHKLMVLHWHTSYKQLQCERMWLHALRSLILIVCVDSGILLLFTFSKDLEERIGSRSYLFSWETVFCYYMLTFLSEFGLCYEGFLKFLWGIECWGNWKCEEKLWETSSCTRETRVHSYYYRLFTGKICWQGCYDPANNLRALWV